MIEFFAALPLSNLIVLCSFTAAVVITVLVLVLKKMKGVNLKFGNNSFSFNNPEQREAVIKIVTDYADFKYNLREESYQGMRDLKMQARRYANLQLDQWIQRMTTEYLLYIKKYEATDFQSYRITMGVFNLLVESLRVRILKFAMEVFEQNHLRDKNPKELMELSQRHYTRIEDIFNEYTQLNWLNEMLPYETLQEVCNNLKPFNEKLVLSVLEMFVTLSNQKYELINFINEVDTAVRMKVQKTGVLPINALTVVSNIYISGIGINKEIVVSWLESVKGDEK